MDHRIDWQATSYNELHVTKMPKVNTDERCIVVLLQIQHLYLFKVNSAAHLNINHDININKGGIEYVYVFTKVRWVEYRYRYPKFDLDFFGAFYYNYGTD